MNNRRRSVIIANEESGGGGVTAPDFSTATWAEIQAYINQYGTNGFADQIGASRYININNSNYVAQLSNVTGNLYELVKSPGSYTGFVVEMYRCPVTSKMCETNDNTGALSSINPIGTTTLPAIKELLPNDLKNILAEVKIIKANSGTDGTLVSSNVDVFIPAAKEIMGGQNNGARSEENDALTEWEFYTTHTSQYSRIRMGPDGSISSWFTRSPVANDTGRFVGFSTTGAKTNANATGSLAIVACFCLAPQLPAPSVPDFSTAPWSEIQEYINENGTNGFADQVGKTREITLSDNTTHTLRLANATGNLYELADGSAYTGMIVEFADCVTTSKWATDGSSTGPLGDADPIGTTTLPAIKALLPVDLQSVLTSVKVVSAKQATERTLVSSDMDLFIPAEKEILGRANKSWGGEAKVLTWWKYYETHNAATDCIKQLNGANTIWWLRSPDEVYNGYPINVSASGDISSNLTANYTEGISPCFCLAPTPTPPAPTPTSFATDDWATIKYAVDNNLASAVYSVGDTKTITLSDNSVHTLRIANITGNLYEYADNAGTYTGFIVEFTDCFSYSTFQNIASNAGALGAISPMGTTTLPAIKALLPQGLQDILATVKVLKSNSGTDGTLVSSDMDLFLPALKEVYGGNDSTPEEQAALTRWQYYSNVQNYTKKYNNNAVTWWMRSPYKTSTSSIWVYSSSYVWDIKQANINCYVSPCFCI